jgi:phosphonate transport system substrate-binding protein
MAKKASVFAILVSVLAVGCQSGRTISSEAVLRVAMIPSTDPGKIVRESQPLVNYLERETSSRVELVVPTNYAAVVEAIANDRVDIAYLGGFTFVQASQRAGVRPLVQRERDQNFHSVFITQPGSGINSLADLNGRSFAFGDVNSTSGHLMPAYYMREAGIDPSALAKTLYTGGHDATALAVANAKVHAGAMDELVYATMMKTGKITPTQVKIFYTTPAFFIVYLANRSNPTVIGELALAGHCVLEAQAVSEALYLCETENVDVIVIGADVEDPDVIEAQMRRITIKLKPEATVKELIWELSQLFPDKTATIQ